MIHGLISSFGKYAKKAFLGVALLGAFSMVVPSMPTAKAAVGGDTEALLLSCIDYRLIDETEAYMAGRGLKNKYDQIILAGASLGAHNDKFPAWGETFAEHVDVAIKLHNIHKVIIMDHRDCGAYKVILGHQDLAKERDKETKIHLEQMNALADLIQEKHPNLEVELLIIDLEGKVEKLGERKAHGH
jgi:carbonic anhydrase